MGVVVFVVVVLQLVQLVGVYRCVRIFNEIKKTDIRTMASLTAWEIWFDSLPLARIGMAKKTEKKATKRAAK